MSVRIRLTKNHSSKKKIAYLLHVTEEVLKQKKKVRIEELMFILGYMSVEYFKRSILKFLTTLNGCIDTEGDYVVWICEEEAEVVE